VLSLLDTGGGPAQGKGAIGVGPLRLWPGGLCLSRAIGDFDVGESVLSLPYISQVIYVFLLAATLHSADESQPVSSEMSADRDHF
jgi:hypothetical protein